MNYSSSNHKYDPRFKVKILDSNYIMILLCYQGHEELWSQLRSNTALINFQNLHANQMHSSKT